MASRRRARAELDRRPRHCPGPRGGGHARGFGARDGGRACSTRIDRAAASASRARLVHERPIRDRQGGPGAGIGGFLWLLPEDRGEARAVALADVRRIEVFAGENRAGGAVIGTALGALIGMTAGLVAGTIYVDSGGSRGEHEGLAIAYLTLLGGAIGAPVGAVTGGIRGLDRWEQVE
jgi:hypothetical protein